MTVEYYLTSATDPIMARIVAKRVNAKYLDKMDVDFLALGKEYHDKFVYMINDDVEQGKAAVERMKSGAVSAGTKDPRMVYLNPLEALDRFRKDHPDVVITDYNMKRKFNIQGSDVIRKMKEMETQLG